MAIQFNLKQTDRGFALPLLPAQTECRVIHPGSECTYDFTHPSLAEMKPERALGLLVNRDAQNFSVAALGVRQALRNYRTVPMSDDFLDTTVRVCGEIIDPDSTRNVSKEKRSQNPRIRADARDTLRTIGLIPELLLRVNQELAMHTYTVLADDAFEMEKTKINLAPYVRHIGALFSSDKRNSLIAEQKRGTLKPSLPILEDPYSDGMPSPRFEDMDLALLVRCGKIPFSNASREFIAVRIRDFIRTDDPSIYDAGRISECARVLLGFVESTRTAEGKYPYLFGVGYEAMETLRRLALSDAGRLVSKSVREEIFPVLSVISGEVNSGLRNYVTEIAVAFHPSKAIPEGQ